MQPMAATTDRVFQTVPAALFPADAPPVVLLEIDGHPRWLVREGTPLDVVIADLDRIGTHLVRHGIWQPQPDDEQKPPPSRLRHAS